MPNPMGIPPDDLDDVMLGRMFKEAEVFYKLELRRLKSGSLFCFAAQCSLSAEVLNMLFEFGMVL